MGRDEVVAVLLERAVEVLDAPELTEADDFRGYGVDSLAVVEWVMDLEDALGVVLTEDDVTGAATVGALADVVVQKRV
jgi:acyl carrier protein